jgi:hypothetical protein
VKPGRIGNLEPDSSDQQVFAVGILQLRVPGVQKGGYPYIVGARIAGS